MRGRRRGCGGVVDARVAPATRPDLADDVLAALARAGYVLFATWLLYVAYKLTGLAAAYPHILVLPTLLVVTWRDATHVASQSSD
jgi:hypothetical protein